MNLLPTYRELKERLPITPSQAAFIEKNRQTIVRILQGSDPRLLLIVGPCSIHDIASAKEFAHHLKELSSLISNECFVVMRVYCEKPRTIAGWKGFLYDPFLDGSTQISTGIEQTRQLLLDLTDLGMPAATEFLDPLTAFYYEDLVSWGSIGARTSSSPIHRQLASLLPMPIGFKNGIAGNVSAAIEGVIAASHMHTFVGIDENGRKSILKSLGNQDAHVVLRGGESGPNYDSLSIAEALNKLKQAKLPTGLIVDCSHHNSNKLHYQQIEVFQSILLQVLEGNTHIRGCMIESHLFADSQPMVFDPVQLKYGVSITDPCLDWKSTRHLLLWGAQHLAQQARAQESARKVQIIEPILIS